MSEIEQLREYAQNLRRDLEDARREIAGLRWIECDGVTPALYVKPSDVIDVQFRDGTVERAKANSFAWTHRGLDTDAIRYRLAGGAA